MSRNEFICDCNAIHQEVVESTKKQMYVTERQKGGGCFWLRKNNM